MMLISLISQRLIGISIVLHTIQKKIYIKLWLTLELTALFSLEALKIFLMEVLRGQQLHIS